jgi:hypothetical protein
MKSKLLVCLLILGLFSFSSCATTEVAGLWKEETTVIAPVKRIMVIGVFKESGIQKNLEQALVKKINSIGGVAFPSYKVFELAQMKDETFLAGKLNEVKAEAVIFVRATDRDKIGSYTPGEIYDTPPDYYRNMYEFAKRAQDDVISVVSPSPVNLMKNEFNYQKFTIETNVYFTETNKLVLSLASDTDTFFQNETVVKNISDTIGKILLAENIILK